MRALAIDALLNLCNGEEAIVTTAEIRDATGRADLSVDSVGRILSSLNLQKVRNAQRRGWRITKEDLHRLSVISVTENTPVSQTEKGHMIMVDIEQLRELLAANDGPKWARVKNLTHNHVIMPHPERPNELTASATLGPHETKVVSAAIFDDTVQGQQNRDLERLGLISIEFVDSYDAKPEEDAGRRAAFASDVRLGDPALEALAAEVLNYPGDDLPSEPYFTANGLAKPDPGTIVWSIIMHEPQQGEPGVNGPVKWDFLAKVYRPFLQVLLERERRWKNRPGIVALLEKRIEQLSDATLLATKSEFERQEFLKKQGLRI